LKWIKLFENFDSRDPKEILSLYEDIKSVLYIIEDASDSYEVKLKYYVKDYYIPSSFSFSSLSSDIV
jgi:hypothetical protein